MVNSPNKVTAPQISVVVPAYKEAKSIIPFLERMQKVLEKMSVSYEILFCLDPSSDNTEEVILHQIDMDSNIKLIVFSRRFGQPAATMAGILNCKGEACLVIDVDLQDPPELLERMYEKVQQGFEVVYAQRESREGETFIKKIISYTGYAIINRLSDVKIPRNTGDFRLMTRRVIEALRELNETHGFLRGLVAFVGFSQTAIKYNRDARFAGKGNYNQFLGSLKIGLNGLVSFSTRPLQMMSLFGAILAGFSFLLGFWYVIQKIWGFQLTPGLSTTILVITFFSGVQLLCLGLIGEYLGRIYDEVKHRPQYIVDRFINKQRES